MLEECCGSTDPCCGSTDPCCAGDCDKGSITGDPHIVTFDNLRYDCQGRGEFILAQSIDSGMRIHGLFEQYNNNAHVTVATGVAITAGAGTPIVQLTIPKGEQTLELCIDRGPCFDASTGYEDGDVRVTSESGTSRILYTLTELYVIVSHSRTFINIVAKLPSKYRNEDIRGLLGSPDDDATSDWMASDGTVLQLPTTDLRRQEAYDYCSQHWCIRDADDSLFVYDTVYDFEYYSGCDEVFPGAVDTSGASAELRALCGTDEACLIEGIELGIEGARWLLEAESGIFGTSLSARFRAAPATIVVSVPINIVLTVDLTEVAMNVSDVEAFYVYRVNSATREVGDTSIVALKDVGLGVGLDTDGGDLIFSNVLPILSTIAGETLSFKAVPVIQGTPDPSSSLVSMALNAVTSFSQDSGIGIDNKDTIGVITSDSTEGLILVVDYSWPADVSDLDTATLFLGYSVGYSCPKPANYLLWTTRDVQSNGGGTETARVLLGDAFDDGMWTSQVMVTLNAGWYASTFIERPASITAYTEKMLSDGSVVPDNNAVTFLISPGFQEGCSSTSVAVANVTVGSDGKVNIEMTPSFEG